MARQVMYVSDLSGEPIVEGEEAKLSITVDRKMYVGEARPDEVADLISKLREQKMRGRRKRRADAPVE